MTFRVLIFALRYQDVTWIVVGSGEEVVRRLFYWVYVCE